MSVKGGVEMEKKGKDAAKIIVYYDESGGVCEVEAIPPCQIIAEGDKVTPKFVQDIISKRGDKVEIKPQTAVHVYGSPGCIIYIGGYPICICCS